MLPGTDAVCHQAAKVGLGVDLGDIRDYVSANDDGTATMLWAMHRLDWAGPSGRWRHRWWSTARGRTPARRTARCDPAPRRVADLEAGEFEPRCPDCGDTLSPGLVREDAPTDPRNVYAATKLHQEHLCTAWAREHDAAVTALRYHNVYGARMPRDTPYAGVASIFRSQLAAGQDPLVFEDGGQRRDFVHVEDVARANVSALTAPTTFDGAVNIASGRPRTLLDMARVLATADGNGREPQVTGRFRVGDVRHVVADPTLARTAIGFSADITPEEGLVRFAGDPLRRPPAGTS